MPQLQNSFYHKKDHNPESALITMPLVLRCPAEPAVQIIAMGLMGKKMTMKYMMCTVAGKTTVCACMILEWVGSSPAIRLGRSTPITRRISLRETNLFYLLIWMVQKKLLLTIRALPLL